MAAEVSSLVRILGGGYGGNEDDGGGGKAVALITRDLLGGCSKLGQQELDLDVHVPSGWEKRLDMMSGKIYLEPRASDLNPSPTQRRQQSHLQDLNLPPQAAAAVVPSSASTLLPDETLDLKLVLPAAASAACQSVCTLEKVKSALERAERGSSSSAGRKRPSSTEASSASSAEEASAEEGPARMFAAGCPGCLLYVLISSRNPKCPRCDTVVPSPAPKRPKLDLNVAV